MYSQLSVNMVYVWSVVCEHGVRSVVCEHGVWSNPLTTKHIRMKFWSDKVNQITYCTPFLCFEFIWYRVLLKANLTIPAALLEGGFTVLVSGGMFGARLLFSLH